MRHAAALIAAAMIALASPAASWNVVKDWFDTNTKFLDYRVKNSKFARDAKKAFKGDCLLEGVTLTLYEAEDC